MRRGSHTVFGSPHTCISAASVLARDPVRKSGPLGAARSLSAGIRAVTGEMFTVARMLQQGADMEHAARREPKLLRLYLGLFALVALTTLLAASWLRFFVPQRHRQARVRDVSWLQPSGR
jgi:hypothetical protein